MTEPWDRCPAVAAMCRCRYLAGHDGPHECSEIEECDGAWEGTEPDVTALRMPKGGILGGAGILAALGWENKLPYTNEQVIDL